MVPLVASDGHLVHCSAAHMANNRRIALILCANILLDDTRDWLVQARSARTPAKAVLGSDASRYLRELPVRILVLLLLGGVVAAVAPVPQAPAQDFYRGKGMTLFAGQPPGGGIDSEMRLVAQFLGRNIPGEPAIVPRNMPGAGGLILGNHLYSVAKPDGLTLGMPGRTGFVLAPIISAADTKYDLRKFTWIGSSASSNLVLWMRRQSNIKSFDDLRRANRQIIIAGSGSTTSNSIIPEVLAKDENMPVKVVHGYTGIIDAVLAVERGEADGVLCQRASIRPDMLSSGGVVPVFQLFDMEPGLPILERLVMDPKEKALLE